MFRKGVFPPYSGFNKSKLWCTWTWRWLQERCIAMSTNSITYITHQRPFTITQSYVPEDWTIRELGYARFKLWIWFFSWMRWHLQVNIITELAKSRLTISTDECIRWARYSWNILSHANLTKSSKQQLRI